MEASEMREILTAWVGGRDVSQAQAKAVFDAVMAGELSPAQIAAVLVALKAKGETVAEIAGAALAMRAASTKVPVDIPALVDTCGTGGSGVAKLFNISTAAAFVAAAAGAQVAKHGNRAVSSKSGSADVLEAAGASLALNPQQVARCIEEVGVGFLFAPSHHQAMRHAGPVRRELGIGTVFNLLGPLTNPAGATRQVLGVFATEWQRPLADVSQALGSNHVLVVHSDGLDELSIHAPSQVVEMRLGEIDAYQISPSDFGMRQRSVDDLHAATPLASLALLQGALNGSHEAAADIVALNAGAAIYASGVCTSLSSGVACAQDIVATGQAARRFSEFVDLTRAMSAS